MDLKGKKILITGSEGFIGSHLVERLLQEDCEIRAFVYYNFSNSWGWLDSLHRDELNKIEIFTGDIRDVNRVKAAVKATDAVFHLAALIGIPYSYDSPDHYVETNIKGTLNILQASMDSRVEKILVTSTSEVYGTAKYVPIDEKHPKQGQSPYSATKIGADFIAESFYRSFDLPVVIARPFNTYGPRQSARAVIPAIITQLLSGKKEIKLGALHPKRDLVYVKDAVEAFMQIAKSDKIIGEEINIASQTEISIGELAQKLISMINPEARVVKDQMRLRPRQSEVERLLGSNEKIMRLTNWKPKYSLDEGLKETIEWFKNKENLKLYKSNIYNV
ncbi:MAG: SDR family NAD(P)-dependent oxidoreductase [Candidatus Omnitrophota bacterium]|nr:MAG: SDR family NAD(P)-dependent oxidoreductase [Candidatus Omnitrophota bacterium]